MRLITARTVEAFGKQHADARQALADWCAMVQAARWTSAADLRGSVPSSRPISDRRVVFKIQGNKYRIICEVRYGNDDHSGIVRVQFIGTHAEYDSIDARTVTIRPSRT